MSSDGIETVDVLIIGAGPAGLSTGLHLLQRSSGWAERMLVLDKAHHPRFKLCGGGVTRLGVSVLVKLGLPFPLPIPHAMVEDVRMKYGWQTIHVRGRPQFTVYNRAEMDAYLASQLQSRGGQMRQDEQVTEIRREVNGQFHVTTTCGAYLARVLVGADGSKGITRRMFDHQKLNRQPSGSWRGGFRVARALERLYPAVEQSPTFNERYALFEFTPLRRGLRGYLWDFPSRKSGLPYFNRGVYDTGWFVRRRPNLPGLLDDFVQGLDLKQDQGDLQGHPILLYDPRRPLSIPGLLLAGDAAGIDPLLGEGIAPSLAYGDVAAQAIEDAFRRRDFSLRDYNRRVQSSIVGNYLTFRWTVAQVAYRMARVPGFLRGLWFFAQGVAWLWPEPPPLY